MFDGIIVGAGPAGSTAAYHRAKQGRSVLVLETACLLRNKPGDRVSGAIEQIGKILCGELRYADIANRALKKLMPFQNVGRWKKEYS